MLEGELELEEKKIEHLLGAFIIKTNLVFFFSSSLYFN